MPVALVTGGNTGIGRAATVALAEAGFDVGVAWHRDEDRARSVVHEVNNAGRRCELRRLDLRAGDEGALAVGELAERLGGVDVLVNNAGGGVSGPVLDLTPEVWREVVEVNLTGAFLVAQAAARLMVERGGGGAIVNVTSVHERIPLRGHAPYTVAKHGLGGLTKVMALELAAHGIRVNSVAPGQIATALTEQEDQEPREMSAPVGRAGYAREVAALIVWLASDAASYVTGASYVVDGGLSLIAADHQ
jgi:NAD(P)-dependent dehydrogenase (short-subunit alcohol dehydrogenase family)